MKNIFAMNVTEDKHNTIYDGERFIERRISQMQENSLGQAVEMYEILRDNVQEPTYIKVLKGISGYMGIVCFILILNGLNMFVLGLGIACLLSWCALSYYTHKLTNAKMENEEYKVQERKIERIIENSKLELSIPEDAEQIDILRFFYTEKNGKQKVVAKGTNKYFNIPVYVYKKNEELHLSSMRLAMHFPISKITAIKEVDKCIPLAAWNKVLPFNEGEYKKYKMTANQFGNIYIKTYYTIHFHFEENDYEMFIPPYDVKKIAELTNLPVTK